MMKTIVLTLTAASLALPALASAAPSPKEERVGVGSGLLVGAAAGGPIGMIFGAAIGGLIGNKMHKDSTERDEYRARHEAAVKDLETLETMLAGNERDLAELRASLNAQSSRFRDALQQTLAAEIYFHTGESAIDPNTEARLTRIGSVVRLIDDFSIVVEGHADPRGDDAYNEQLSADRANAVRNVLVAAGIPADRVSAMAIGETASDSAEDDLDSLALDRRVQVNLVFPGADNRLAHQ